MHADLRIVPCEQGSPEWFAARLGKVTSSRAKAATMAPSTKTYQRAKAEMVVELTTGLAARSVVSAYALDEGMRLEPDALAAYEARTGNAVRRIGFLTRASQPRCGYSPDGTISREGLIELKCPFAANHMLYTTQGIPNTYMPQLLHALWFTGADWIDFVSFNPDFPPAQQIAIHRLLPPADLIAAYEAKVSAFLADVESAISLGQAAANVAV